jgi:UTP--glucose-1-phosphate uridylyltransferase
MRKIRKAVFPVGGMGTRFLPATKAMPKELLPIIDKPLIQFAAEEAIAAGISELIFVTGRSKRAIEDHFDANAELEAALERAGKDEILESVRSITPRGVNCVFVRQGEPLGLGHAVLRARSVIGEEPFAVLLPDEHMTGERLPTRALVETWEATGASALSVLRMPRSEIGGYGVVRPEGEIAPGVARMAGIVEKPTPDLAPSDLASIGRYVFDPRIFDHLERQAPGAGGEIQLADAVDALCREADVAAVTFSGRRYDCGSKIGYLEAILDAALAHPEFSAPFMDLLRDRSTALLAGLMRAA